MRIGGVMLLPLPTYKGPIPFELLNLEMRNNVIFRIQYDVKVVKKRKKA